MKTIFFSILFTIIVTIVLTSNSFAATGGMGGEGDPCGDPFPPCPIPLDGGVTALLIAGAMYGGKKIFDSTKGNDTKNN